MTGSAPAVEYSVLVGRRRAVVGFRYPASKCKPGEGDNIVGDDERRIASHCMAVLGMPSTLQYKWGARVSAAFIAKAISGARVIGGRTGNQPERNVMKKAKKKTKEKPVKKAKKKSVKSAARTSQRSGGSGGSGRNGPRKCSVCKQFGHNSRSHDTYGGLIER